MGSNVISIKVFLCFTRHPLYLHVVSCLRFAFLDGPSRFSRAFSSMPFRYFLFVVLIVHLLIVKSPVRFVFINYYVINYFEHSRDIDRVQALSLFFP